jgi:hypothetical protein
MKKVLIIPDIHQQVSRAREILKRESHKVDEVVFTGDFFEPKGKDPSNPRDTAVFYKEVLENPKNVVLIGNHDLHYMFSSRWVACSNWQRSASEAVKEIVGDLIHTRTRFYYDEPDHDVFFTHAGFKNGLVECRSAAEVRSGIDVAVEYDIKLIETDEFPQLNAVSDIRGGWAINGGVTWCDLSEFVNVPGLTQIFGHSIGKRPRLIKKRVSDIEEGSVTVNARGQSVCLDCLLNHYAILSSHGLEIKHTDTGKDYAIVRF